MCRLYHEIIPSDCRLDIDSYSYIDRCISALPLFVFPFRIISQAAISPSKLIAVGTIYTMFLGGAIEHVMTIAANVYGFKKRRVFSALLPEGSFLFKAQEESEQGFKGTIKAILTSYAYFIIWYAMSYLYLGNRLHGMFDAKSVEVVDAFYLSFTAISVGPAGLSPISPYTKLLVMSEVAVGLFYAVLVFSILGEWIKRSNEPIA